MELPAFINVASVPPYPPAEDIGYTVSGVVEDKLLICGGKNNNLLTFALESYGLTPKEDKYDCQVINFYC